MIVSSDCASKNNPPVSLVHSPEMINIDLTSEKRLYFFLQTSAESVKIRTDTAEDGK